MLCNNSAMFESTLYSGHVQCLDGIP